MTVQKITFEKSLLILLLPWSAIFFILSVTSLLIALKTQCGVEKAAEDNFAEKKGEGEKVDEVMVEATNVKVTGNQKQVEVTPKVVVYVFVVVLRGVRLNIARMRKNLRKR